MSCFLERHYARKCVKGSLNSWEESLTDCVGEFIGFEGEEIHTKEDIQTESPTQLEMSVIDHNVSHNESSHINWNSFQLNGGGVKPMNKKQVSTILSVIAGTYSRFSQDQQFELSSLVLQVQELTSIDKAQ